MNSNIYSHINDKKNIVLVDSRIGDKYRQVLKNLGKEILFVSPHKNLYEAVSGHPDMQFYYLGEDDLLYAPGIELDLFKKLEKNFNMVQGEAELVDNYPNNISYNAARVGEFVFHNFLYTDKVLLREIEKRKMKKIHVKQGYTKCSICVVDNNSIITADNGIAKVAKENNIDVLLIKPEREIILKGLDYGFIGGSTGLLDSGKLGVLGNARRLTSYDEIYKFTKERGVDIVSLSDGDIEDFGSIITFLKY